MTLRYSLSTGQHWFFSSSNILFFFSLKIKLRYQFHIDFPIYCQLLISFSPCVQNANQKYSGHKALQGIDINIICHVRSKVVTYDSNRAISIASIQKFRRNKILFVEIQRIFCMTVTVEFNSRGRNLWRDNIVY